MQHGQGVGIKDCRQSPRLSNGTASLNWKGTKLPHCSAAPITAKWCGGGGGTMLVTTSIQVVYATATFWQVLCHIMGLGWEFKFY